MQTDPQLVEITFPPHVGVAIGLLVLAVVVLLCGWLIDAIIADAERRK